MPLTIHDIKNAQQRIAPFIKKTPILSSTLLNKWLGHEVFFKAECMQKIGAFKVRGACNTVSWLIENNIRPKKLIANSSGNHAQAVAYAARQFNIPSTIYMPKYASKVKIQATKAYGAHVDLSENRIITDEKVKKASEEEGTYWIHPFNNVKVIAGQGTAAYEALHQVNDIDAVFAPCGGGGLLSGTLIAARALASRAKVIGAEPLNANDAAESLRTGSIQKLTSTPDTLADGAMTMSVGDITFEYLKQLDDFYEVPEENIIYWTQWLTHLLKIHIEPTSAMAMEAAVQWLKKQKSKKKVVLVLSGGNIDHLVQKKIWNTNHLDITPNRHL
ncbi:serine/threonine dehydratase [Carboxylicivirga linearis]|uniref:Serine/threonine dehydratase n=1 Tax=Carboxylicivirga linearis TaxID=1628157 RepID=A0ABS5JRX8_9BACT|nr:serine/threonine dehydratase [Carboxylicivirga linearis]MBS2097592.1 serine/threonine dehydratase [Carboxylicivirga linearis]